MNAFVYGLLILLVCMAMCPPSWAFRDEAIFEDEDIYTNALPAVERTGLTVPGTKWCGPGNTASSYNDLGLERETDKCCREHDHCEHIIEPARSLYGLQNFDLFPILECSCEQKFINCLQSVNSMVSNGLGRIYYTHRSRCFAEGYPITNCAQYQLGLLQIRCIRYTVNELVGKKWQFYDMPYYAKGNRHS